MVSVGGTFLSVYLLSCIRCSSPARLFRNLTLSDFRTYIYVRNSKTIATPVRIYTYTDFAIEIWGFNRHLTDNLRYHQHEVFTCFRLLGNQHVYQSGEKSSLLKFFVVFCEFFNVKIAGQSSNSSIDMENNNKLYGFLL